MPRVKYCLPSLQREIEDDMRSRKGGMLTVSDVSRELGLADLKRCRIWLSDVPKVVVNGRPRYRGADVAKKIYDNMEVPA